MPPPIPVILAPYNPSWPLLAVEHAERLKEHGPAIVAIHHIGSTAVPGLTAKPIIDLMALVTDLGSLDSERSRIEALGYEWHGEFGMPGRRYCTLSDEAGTRIVQIHFFKTDSPHARRHIAFRNYLRAHPEAARAYENEKRRARNLHPADSHAYSDEKAAWIQAAEAASMTWFAGECRTGIFTTPAFLETARTRLRPFQLSDAEAAFGWLGDPEVMRFIPHGADASMEASAARIAKYLEHESKYGFSKWIILDRGTGEPIGDSGFYHLPDSRRVELGYRLARPWWGGGLATEVASKWIEVAREWYGFDSIYAFANPNNAPSLRVMEKIGFHYSHREKLYGMDAPLYVLEPRKI